MELYYEQNVVNRNIDAKAKKTKRMNIIKTVCYILALFAIASSMVFVTDKGFGVIIAIDVAVAVPFVAAGLVIGHINKRNNVEYDYEIDGEYLKITEVYYRDKRKIRYNIRLRTIESVGMFDSDGYRRCEGQAVKKQLAIVNYDNEKAIIYILYIAEKGRQILFIEPDRGFIMTLRRTVSAVTVFDKSMSEFESYLESLNDDDDDDDEYDDEYGEDAGDGAEEEPSAEGESNGEKIKAGTADSEAPQEGAAE